MTTHQVSPLVAQIVTAQFAQSQDTADALINSLTSQIADLNAEVEAIRDGVTGAIDALAVEDADVIRGALYPSAESVAFFRDLGIR